METHHTINMEQAMRLIRRDYPDAELLTVTPFEQAYRLTPDDVAEITVQTNSPTANRAIYGTTAEGIVTMYAN